VEAFLCPSEDFLRAIRPGISDGFMMACSGIEWVKPMKRRTADTWSDITKREEGMPHQEDWSLWSLSSDAAGFYAFAPRADGAALELEYKGSANLSRSSSGEPARARADCDLPIDYDGTVPTGRSLVFLGSMGEMDGVSLSAAVVWQVSAWPEEQVKYVQSVGNTETWIRKGREGIATMADAASAWVAGASASERAEDDQWTVTLPGGEYFRIVAIGRPQEKPMQWWDPAGNPVVPNPRWGRDAAGDYLAIAFEASKGAGGALRGREEGTPGLPIYGITSSSEGGTVLRIKKSDWEKAVEEERDLRLTIGYEVGEWKERGEIREGEDLEVDGVVYDLEEVKIQVHAGNNLVHVNVDMKYTFHPDVAVGIGVVDTDGNVMPVHSQKIVYNRPPAGHEARYFSGRFIHDAEIDHFVLLTRLRDWKTLPKFALEPKGGL
jgi:hypothetical protein